MSLAGALIYITKWPLAPYIFMVGSILVAIAQIFSPPKKSSVNIRRLHRQQVFGALLLVATGPLMIFLHGNEWKRMDRVPYAGRHHRTVHLHPPAARRREGEESAKH